MEKEAVATLTLRSAKSVCGNQTVMAKVGKGLSP